MADDNLQRAKNETMFREVNERVIELRDGNEVEVLCECGAAGCIESVNITLAEYESVRADPGAFVIAPGHDNAEVDRVKAQGPDFLIVTKKGSAGDFARKHDPRG